MPKRRWFEGIWLQEPIIVSIKENHQHFLNCVEEHSRKIVNLPFIFFKNHCSIQKINDYRCRTYHGTNHRLQQYEKRLWIFQFPLIPKTSKRLLYRAMYNILKGYYINLVFVSPTLRLTVVSKCEIMNLVLYISFLFWISTYIQCQFRFINLKSRAELLIISK